MKNLTSTAAMLVAITAGSATHAQGLGGDWYASVFAGFGAATQDYDNYDGFPDFEAEYESDSGTLFGATVGRKMSGGLRVEAELSYALYEMGDADSNYGGYVLREDNVEAAATYLLGNVWYDIPDIGGGAGIAPYVGGGLGVAVLSNSDDGAGFDFDDSTGLAYQIGAGVQYPVGAGAIDVGYRFKGAMVDPKGGDFIGLFEDLTLSTNNLQIAYAFSF